MTTYAHVPADVHLSSRWMTMVVPGEERVIEWRDCERCEGKGWWGHSYVQKFRIIDMPGQEFSYIGGSKFMCHPCRGSGKVMDRFYTRGVSLPPLISRKQTR